MSSSVRFRGLVALALLVAAGCSATETPLPPPPPPALFVWPTLPEPTTTALPADEAAELQTVLDTTVALRAQFPGAAVGADGITAAAITDRGVWRGAAGVDGNGRPLTPGSTAAIVDVTTTFTAAEVLRLAGAGRIDLDAPLERYLLHRRIAGAATVRQFLGMRGGLADIDDADGQALAAAFRFDPGRSWRPDDELARYRGPVATPGSDTGYSRLNAMLLGEAVEQVTGRPLAAVLRDDLVARAGLPHVGFWGEGVPDAAPASSLPDRDLLVAGYARTEAGASGMTADAMSVALWGYDLYGSRVLPPEAVVAMVTPAGSGQIDGGFRYGLGTVLFSQTLGLGDAFGHDGHGIGAQSLLVVVPARHVAVAVLVVDEMTAVRGVAQNLFAALSRHLSG